MTTDLVVLNPVAQLASDLAKPSSFPHRPDSLNGGRVGLYWNRKQGGNFALQAVEEQLQRRHPELKAQLYHGPRPISDELIRDIKSSCNIIVGATAD